MQGTQKESATRLVLGADGGTAIQVAGLWVSYGRRPVLRDLELEVQSGDFLAIFGANGSGKTTLIHSLATLMRPQKGSLYVGGLDALRYRGVARRLLGVVTHQSLLYDNLTPVENLEFYSRLHRVPNGKSRVQDLLQRVGMENLQDQPVSTLSHGMRKKLMVARALLHDPPILLLDEPFTGLDFEAQAAVRDLLKEEAQGPRTVVMTTHDLRLGLSLSDQVAILAEGHIKYQASTSSVSLSEFRRAYQALVRAAL